MSSIDTLREIRRETIESEPDLFGLIDLSREIMLRDPHLYRPVRLSDSPSAPFDADEYLPHPNLRKGYPDILSDLEARNEFIKEIESLGEAILDDAFLCLGEDAQKELDYFLKDPEAHFVHTTTWLLGRIRAIGESAAYKEEDQSNNYQPFRISPKIIGEYPDTRVEPTCLGKSILVASFFNKTNLPMFHAGVIETADGQLGMSQMTLFRSGIANQPTGRMQTLPSLTGAYSHNLSQRFTHNGFHAAVYVKVGSHWAQLDPNYKQNRLVDEYDSKDLDNTYQMIQDQEETTPHGCIELKIHRLGILFEDIAKTLNNDHVLDPTEIEQVILDGPIEETYARLIQYVFQPFLSDEWIGEMPPKEDEPTLTQSEYILRMMYHYLSVSSEEVQACISSTLREFVFTDFDPDFHETAEQREKRKANTKDDKEGDAQEEEEEEIEIPRSISDSLARMHTDKAYRQSRIEDLLSTPHLLLLKMYTFYIDAMGDSAKMHTGIYGGSPAYRIGISAMSDIAVYYGDPLPLSTWMSYWPNDVSFAEHRNQRTSPAQTQLAKAVMSLIINTKGHLTQTSIFPIITETLIEIEGEKDG